MSVIIHGDEFNLAKMSGFDASIKITYRHEVEEKLCLLLGDIGDTCSFPPMIDKLATRIDHFFMGEIPAIPPVHTNQYLRPIAQILIRN